MAYIRIVDLTESTTPTPSSSFIEAEVSGISKKISLETIVNLAGTGTSGQIGTNGTSGTSGTRGTSGSSGTSGTRGTSGSSGTSGHGTSGTSGTSSTSGGYNFIDTVPSIDTTVETETTSITIKTMRMFGVGGQVPSLDINSTPVTPTKTTGDENIYYYTFSPSLSVGENVYEIISNNGTELTKTLTITRTGVAPSCALTHTLYMKSGTYTITMTTDYDLISTPTLSASIGSLSAFSGSGKTWTATLTITAENGSGTFSNAVMEGAGGIGNTINSGATYFVDTVIPVIGTANFSTTVWHYETGSMTCTIGMGETTTGFTGFIDLSNFGLSSSYALTSSGNNMLATFTPARVNAGPDYGENIRVSDRSGNAATPKSTTDNQLQVIAYRVALQNLTFPAYSATSNPLVGVTFETDANSQVQWGEGQTSIGMLTYITDYTVDSHNIIHLDETKWADVIAANALGLLNIDVWEN